MKKHQNKDFRPDSALAWTLDKSYSDEKNEITDSQNASKKHEKEKMKNAFELKHENFIDMSDGSSSSDNDNISYDEETHDLQKREIQSQTHSTSPKVHQEADVSGTTGSYSDLKMNEIAEPNDPAFSSCDDHTNNNHGGRSTSSASHHQRVYSHHSTSSIFPSPQQYCTGDNSYETSTPQSVNQKIWKHQMLHKDYRTMSFDGRMFRNIPDQNKQADAVNPSSLHDVNPRRSLRSGRRQTDDYGNYSNQEMYHMSIYDQHDQHRESETMMIHPQSAQDPSYTDEHKSLLPKQQQQNERSASHHTRVKKQNIKNDIFYYFVYALLNTMMSVPSLYGYASVIFNHSAFTPYLPTLTKLVIWSSAVHQFTFVCISSISFAKAEVQDAGLLFLSCISQHIANSILNDDGTTEEIISTTIAALGIATASLGIMLVLLGRFNCANAVSYLPLPVIGGYLAFIGYFCVIAGVGLCISESMIDGNFFTDLQILCDKKLLLLALPGLASGAIMMLVARYAKNGAILPLVMVLLPASFYIVLCFSGYTIEDARHYKWVGDVTPESSLGKLFDVISFNAVRWDLVFSTRCITIWIGMVFVVSFSSCLDVAAISLDMGEPLNLNKELVTVGLSNVFSGILLGQTGSYIFSQTILTYRTGFHSRWIGGLCSLMFLYFSLSKVNLLEIAPLFFLGSTLIFIGIDLLYEWLIEVAHKLLITEYAVLVVTFLAIQMVGIDGGIIVGLIVAVVEYVVSSSRLPSLRRVTRQSRALWQQDHRNLLQNEVYNSLNPDIVTLEITETVFFGSSLQVFSQICNEVGVDPSPSDMQDIQFASPHLHSVLTPSYRSSPSQNCKKHYPRFLVLDLTQVPNVDASAARSCFQQLAKICSKHGILLCACGANSRVDLMFRSHDVSYSCKEEKKLKELMLDPLNTVTDYVPSGGKLILFPSINECLELCENELLIRKDKLVERPGLGSVGSMLNFLDVDIDVDEIPKVPPSIIFGRMLGIDDKELQCFDCNGSNKLLEVDFVSGEKVFNSNEESNDFYIVLKGAVTIGNIQERKQSSNMDTTVAIGGIFGYVDFGLKRRRSYDAVCKIDGTTVAKVSQEMIDNLRKNEPTLCHIIDQVMLQTSLMELGNI